MNLPGLVGDTQSVTKSEQTRGIINMPTRRATLPESLLL